MSDPIDKYFKIVSQELPFNYGILGDTEGGDGNNKTKMKKKNLRAAIKKGYVWDSYKPLTFCRVARIEWVH